MTIDEFYQESEKRQRSAELDFGVWWRRKAAWPTYRVTYVEDTGEVYASGSDGSFEILGIIEGGRGAAERVLEGWADQCGPQDSLDWVIQRL